MSCKLPFLFI